ncbi:putative anion transporter chloroplastic [Chlorella sorokiniana]|uniref:Anion transporter chloroplastic n=1 Tax=Chlorella sorokiniana TaxID=3076 RepID=A0A2P6TYH0_CHLSO|nr:putative anion transporter chloroplastic [Chlorella sorokiniana]|eukprot:PRW59116.1 putative anion transporter chloroplastic [Chlorella sorokiniana]
MALACLAMALAAVHRVAFSVLALPIQAALGLSMPDMGRAHAALLLGYVLGQIPAGLLADRIGGAHLAAAGLFTWSAACLLFARVPAAANPLAALLVARAALGLAQSCLMPAASALAARWFPPATRSRQTSTVYSAYSVGTVAGLALTPLVAQHVGWASTFTLFGLAGLAAAAATSLGLPTEGPTTAAAQPSQAAGQRAGQGSSPWSKPSWETVQHLGLLCFTHSVISWNFFILQSWLPTLLASLGLSHLPTIGLLSSLPWLATAIVSIAAGGLADRLQVVHGWSAVAVRRAMQLSATLGTGLSLLPLALPGAMLAPAAAMVALVAAVAFQGLTYAGFHSYVQDVAPGSAGLVLAVTNSCGTLVGIGGNLVTGHLAASSWGYAGLFALTVALQAASGVAWLAGAHGRQLAAQGREHGKAA